MVPRIDPLTPTKVVGVAGEDVQLSCPATGQPKPSISWSKQASPLPRCVMEVQGRISIDKELLCVHSVVENDKAYVYVK